MVENNSTIEDTVRAYLADHGGAVEDPEGRHLTDEMARAIGVNRPLALNAILRQMEGNGVITRDVRGLLTYRIALVSAEGTGQPSPGAGSSLTNGASVRAGGGGPGTDGPDATTEAPPETAVGAPSTPPSAAEPAAAEPAAAEPVSGAPVGESAGPESARAVSAGSESAGADRPADAAAAAADRPADAAAAAVTLGGAAGAARPLEPEDQSVSLREALARRAKPVKGKTQAAAAAAGTSTSAPSARPDAPGPNVTSGADITSPLPVASTDAVPPAAPESDAPSEAESTAAPIAAVSLRDALAAQAASNAAAPPQAAPPQAEGPLAPPPSTAASAGTSHTAPVTTSPGAAPGPQPGPQSPAGGYFASLRDSAPPPPVTDWGSTPVGSASTTTTPEVDTEVKGGRSAGLRSRLDMPVQEVKAPPSNTTITAVAVALAGLVLIAVISVIVSRATSHTAPNNFFSASTDACHVVTAADATTMFGVDAGQPHFVLGTCVYDTGSSELIVAVFRQQARAMFDASRTASAQDVPGVGDAAYFVDGRLRVLKGNNLLELTESPIPPNAPTAKMVALASTAVGRL